MYDGRMELLPFVGPPFGLPLWGLLSHLPYAAASVVWAAALGAAFVVLVLASLKLSGGTLGWREVVAGFALGVGFGPITAAISLGQVALLSTAAIVATILAARARSRAGIFGGALVAALQPNLALVLAAQLRDRRTIVALSVAALAALALSAWAGSSLSAIPSYAKIVTQHAQSEWRSAIQTTPASIALAFGASAAIAQTVGRIIAVAVATILVIQLFSRRYDAVTGCAIACATLPLVLPFEHEADLAIAFFPSLLCLRRATGALWVAAAAGTLLVAVNWLDLAQRTTPLATVVALLLCASLATVALGPGPRTVATWVRRETLPIATLVLVLVLSLIAGANPMPVWPDALPAHFHIVNLQTAADAWGYEQLQSGLLHANPLWGALRVLPLLGCLTLWLVASYEAVKIASAKPNSN